jgi:hypothetical protein
MALHPRRHSTSHPLQFIVILSSFHSTLYNLSYWESVVKWTMHKPKYKRLLVKCMCVFLWLVSALCYLKLLREHLNCIIFTKSVCSRRCCKITSL